MSLDSRLRDEVQVTLIATGFDAARTAREEPRKAVPGQAYPEPRVQPETVARADPRPSPMPDTGPMAAPPTVSASQPGTEPAEWRPVWLRRAGTDPVPGPATGPRPKRAKRGPVQRPRSAEGTSDQG
jgi:hypothetical protein